MPARKGLNSVSTLQQLARSPAPVPVPAGVTLTADEEVLWPVFTSARAPGDWKAVDLVLLVRAVQLEVEIRHCHQRLVEEGSTVTTANGGCKANPLHAIIDTLQRQQSSIIRMLGLTRQGDMRTLNARAAKAGRFAAALADDEDGLYAKPNRLLA